MKKLTAALCLVLLSGCVGMEGPTSVRPPVGMAKEAEATQSSLKAQGLSPEALRKRWGLLLDLLDTRFMQANGSDATWYAFEWIDPGTVIRWWVRGCGNFGCGEPYQITVTYVPGDDRLRVVDTVDGRRTYIRVKADGTLEQENSCCKEALWRIDEAGNLQRNGKFQKVSAEQLAAATGGASLSVALGADTAGPAAKAAASTTPTKPAASEAKARAQAAERPTPDSGSEADPVARALKAKFPTLAAGTSTGTLTGGSKQSPKAAIYVLEVPRASRVRLEARSAAFEPTLAIYDAASRTQIASSTDASVAALGAQLNAGTAYLVVVQSSNGKPGDFSLEFNAR